MANRKTDTKKLSNIQSIGYSDIFKKEEALDDLLLKLNLKKTLEILAHYISFVHFGYSNERKQAQIIGEWSGRLPTAVRQTITAKIKEIKKTNGTINFFNNYAAMKVLQRSLVLNSKVTKSKFDEKDELNLFKAYLICNDQWIVKSNRIFADIKDGNPKTYLAKGLLTNNAAILELVSAKDLRFQVLKAAYLFKFLESDKELSKLLNAFIKERGLTSWRQYLNAILSLYVPSSEKSDRPPSRILVKDQIAKKWLSSYTAVAGNIKDEDDFLGIREKPVYKYGKDEYLILNRNFLIDKIYDGLKFDLFKTLKARGIKIKGVSSFLDFNTFLTSNFSEKVFFYNTIERMFNRRAGIRRTGDDVNNFFKNPPDYYIRERTNIMLLELKDVLIEKSAKHSFEFETLWNEIDKKLVGKTEKPKALRQLSLSIEQLMKSYWLEFDRFPLRRKKRKIYPIVLHNNAVLDSAGLNLLLNIEFKKLAKSNKWYSIQDVVLINLDDLVHLMDDFHRKRLILRRLLDKYIQRSYSKHKNAFGSFAHYLSTVIGTRRVKNSMLDLEIKKIIAEPARKRGVP